MDDVKEIISNFQYAIHGAVGGLIRVLTGEEKSFARAIITMIVGATSSHYITPMIEELNLFLFKKEVFSGYGLSFVVGYLGLIILRRLEEYVKTTSLFAFFKYKLKK